MIIVNTYVTRKKKTLAPKIGISEINYWGA